MKREINIIRIDGSVDLNVNGNILFSLDSGDTKKSKKCKCHERVDHEEIKDDPSEDDHYYVGLDRNEDDEEAPVTVELEGPSSLKEFIDQTIQTYGKDRRVNIVIRTKDPKDEEMSEEDKETEEYLKYQEKEDQEIALGMKISEMKNILHDFKETLDKFSKDIGI